MFPNFIDLEIMEPRRNNSHKYSFKDPNLEELRKLATYIILEDATHIIYGDFHILEWKIE